VRANRNFPLTPTLSPWEREQGVLPLDCTKFDLPRRGSAIVSLSLGERAGVRGWLPAIRLINGPALRICEIAHAS